MLHESIKPRSVKYVLMSVFTADGGFDPTNPDGWECSDDIQKLEGKAIDDAEAHGMESWIYKVVPVRRVYRGKVRVVKL